MTLKRSNRHAFLAAVALFSVLAAATGCEDEPIRTYQTPKAPAYVAPTFSPGINPGMGPGTNPGMGPGTNPGVNPGAGAGPATAVWDTPQAWEEDPAPSAMALGVFIVPDETGEARVTVTGLSGSAGGILSNINRWRGQVGLAPIQVIEEQPMIPIQTDRFRAGLMDLSSPEDAGARFDRMLIVLIPRREDNHTWFIKMTGPKETLGRHKAQFVGFVESIRFEEDVR